MAYRIEQDDASNRPRAGPYTYRIYDGDRLIAQYWHDFRGDEHGIDLFDGKADELCSATRMTDIIEGGGGRPLRLTDKAIAYISARQPRP